MGVASWFHERADERTEIDASHRCRPIAQGVRQEQLAVVHHRPARVDDIGNVPRTLCVGSCDQRLASLADDTARIVAVEQSRADGIAAHRSHAVSQEQPARLGLDRRAAVADQDNLPGKLGAISMTRASSHREDIVRFHVIETFVVNPRDHGVLAVHSAWE